MRVFLEDECYWQGISGVEVGNLSAVWIKRVIPEIAEFLSDDAHGRLARVLGLTVSKGVDLFAEREHIGTTDAARRNDLFKRRQDSVVWQHINMARQSQSAAAIPSDNEIVDTVLRHRARTPAGRAIGPAFHTAARRQQIMLLADEVMKAVAYTLVANNFLLAAVVDNQFVVEVPVALATDDVLKQIAQLAGNAATSFLTPFARG